MSATQQEQWMNYIDTNEYENARAVAKALEDYGRPIPTTTPGWNLLSVYLYHSGIPKIVKDALVADRSGSTLSYYATYGGYDQNKIRRGADYSTQDRLLKEKLEHDLLNDDIHEYGPQMGWSPAQKLAHQKKLKEYGLA